MGGLSILVANVATPLCVWGMISSLILYLIELRSLLIQGGEAKLRLATLAFAAGVILLQRLGRIQGPSSAKFYGWLLGLAITAFTAYSAFIYRLPVHPLIVFAVNEVLMILLWWIGHTITSAVSVDSAQDLAAVADGGILTRRKGAKRRHKEVSLDTTIARIESEAELKRATAHESLAPAPEPDESKIEEDKAWSERLPTRHPGRVLFMFALVAIPAFGLGIMLLEGTASSARLHATALLMGYLWCALALLMLSSLNQVRTYYQARQLSIPEGVGLTWLALGFAIATGVMVVAVFLPQPPTLASIYVRHRIVSVYRGAESRYGMRDTVGSQNGSGSDKQPWNREAMNRVLEKRYEPIDKLGDKYLSEVARGSGIEPEVQKALALSVVAHETGSDMFDGIMRLVLAGAILCAGFAGVMVFVVMLMRVREGAGEVRLMLSAFRKPRRKKRKPASPADELALARFRQMANPFGGHYGASDGNTLVRHVWEGLLTYCEAAGAPCPLSATPLEFVASRPEPLEGFEDRAWKIADLFTYSECSGQPIAEDRIKDLASVWSALQIHAEQHFSHAR